MSTAQATTLRFRTFGPDLSVLTIEPAPADPNAPVGPIGSPASPPTKPLFAVDFRGCSGKNPVTASFALPVSNPEVNASLLSLVVATLPLADDQGNPVTRPETPDGWINHPLAKVFSEDVSARLEGGQVDVVISGLPPGNFAARSILEWASE